MRQGYVSKVVGTAIGALALFALTTTFARGEPPAKAKAPLKPRVTTAAAFDVSPPLAELARQQHFRKGPFAPAPGGVIEIRPEPGPVQMDRGWSGDGALQSPGMLRRLRAAAIPSPTPGAFGRASPFPIAPIRRAIRSSSTTSSPTAGS
jgi:hypothetical protein